MYTEQDGDEAGHVEDELFNRQVVDETAGRERIAGQEDLQRGLGVREAEEQVAEHQVERKAGRGQQADGPPERRAAESCRLGCS